MQTASQRADLLRIAVVAGVGSSRSEAASLAQELRLPLLESVGQAGDPFDWYLVFGADGLALRESRGRRPVGLLADFVGGPVGYRRFSGTSRREPLARAMGLRRGFRTVVDATAGLGRDTFQLACMGCTVVAAERSPILAALVRDGLSRAAAHRDEALRKAIARIQLVTGDARSLLMNLNEQQRPEVVYLDPMYSNNPKSSLNKKEMRICRLLVGDDNDAGELLHIACGTARRRVVVKRPRIGRPLAPGAVASCMGRRVRYDLYAPIPRPPL